jgi:hypothetical protein
MKNKMPFFKTLKVYVYRLKKNQFLNKVPYQRQPKFSKFIKQYIKVNTFLLISSLSVLKVFPNKKDTDELTDGLITAKILAKNINILFGVTISESHVALFRKKNGLFQFSILFQETIVKFKIDFKRPKV